MGTQYLLSRKWALNDRFAITDQAGLPQFEVQGRFALRQRLSMRDAATGAEVAAISSRGLGTRYDITAGEIQATVRPRGFFSSRFVVESSAGELEARGNFTGRKYQLLRGGSVVASVSQQLSLRERFTVEVADGEDAVLMLAAILVIEVIRDNRQRQSAAASSG
jgi:uncharacterized protein YxjI